MHMTTILPADIREGDKITATHSDGSSLTGTVVRNRAGTVLYISPTGISRLDVTLAVDRLRDEGYTFSLVSRPRPTFEAGIYRDRDGDLRLRDRDGRWFLIAVGNQASEFRIGSPWDRSDAEIAEVVVHTLNFITPLFEKPGA